MSIHFVAECIFILMSLLVLVACGSAAVSKNARRQASYKRRRQWAVRMDIYYLAVYSCYSHTHIHERP